MADLSIIRETAKNNIGREYCFAKKGEVTYILKDPNSDVYKIGKTKNLRMRILVIRNCCHYGGCDYHLIAFTPGNIEFLVQGAIMDAGIKPAQKWSGVGKKPTELFSIEKDVIDCVIDSFMFQRVQNGMIPSKIAISDCGENRGYLYRYDVTEWVEHPQLRYMPGCENTNKRMTSNALKECKVLLEKRKWKQFLEKLPCDGKKHRFYLQNRKDLMVIRVRASQLKTESRVYSTEIDFSNSRLIISVANPTKQTLKHYE